MSRASSTIAIGLGVDGGVERLEESGEVALLLFLFIDDVHRLVLGGILGAVGGGERVALLGLVFLGRLLCCGRDLEIVAVILETLDSSPWGAARFGRSNKILGCGSAAVVAEARVTEQE